MRRFFIKGRWWLVTLLLLAALAGGAWHFRTELTCWYYLHNLASASPDDRADWIERLAALDDAAVPGLLAQLRSANTQTCANAEAALSFLVRQWPPADARTLAVAQGLRDGFANFSVAGKEAALEWQLVQLNGPAAKGMAAPATALLATTLSSTEPSVRRRGLALANTLLSQVPTTSCVETCCQLVRRELGAPEADCRAQAVRLTLQPTLQKETGLLKQVAALLKDADSAVRRAAVLSVGLDRDVLVEDDLLPLLHDADKEVRRLTALALKQRGLSDNQIVLGKLICDPRPLARLQILEQLPHATELDSMVWLQRLSNDTSDAVRAAAVRAMGDLLTPELVARLEQMAQHDPSPTVRQNALFYLDQER